MYMQGTKPRELSKLFRVSINEVYVLIQRAKQLAKGKSNATLNADEEEKKFKRGRKP